MIIHILNLTLTQGQSQIIVHPALIDAGVERILFDTGYPGQENSLVLELQRLGYELRDLTKVVISHHDHDHMGSLRQLKNLHPGLEVVTSSGEAPFVSGRQTSLRLLQAQEFNLGLVGNAREAGEAFVKYLSGVESCPVDRTVEGDAYLLPGLKVLATPGHMPGHLSLLIEPEGLLLSADALALEDGKLVIPNPQFTLDLPQALESVRKLGELDINKILCYHGGYYSGDPGKALAQILTNPVAL